MMRSTPETATSADLWRRAIDAYRGGRSADAARLCDQLLEIAPMHLPALHIRALIALASGQVELAILWLSRAATLDPTHEAVHSDLAIALFRARRFTDALSVCQRALELHPNAVGLWHTLGVAAKRAGATEMAETAYRRAIELQPDHADAKANLGALLQGRGRIDEAVELYRGALRDRPNHLTALNNFAAALISQGQFAESMPVLRHVLAIAPDDLTATANLALAFTGTPAFAEGVALYRRAHSLSGDITYRLKGDLAIPPLLATRDEILEFRAGFERRLDALLDTRFVLDDPCASMARTTFYLAYQGLDDRTLQEKTARLYAQACPSLRYVAPELRSGGLPRSRPLRVGFVSMFLRSHTIGKLFRGLIAGLDRAQFEPHVFTPSAPGDPVLDYFARQGVRVWPLPATLEAGRSMIAQQRLDLLFFTDVGMDPFTYFLAFARLAPVQFASWGHPVTTGIPSIDCFLSHEHCEFGNTASQYTERLVQLRADVSYTYYCRPSPGAGGKSRQDYGLPEGRTLYMCPHALFKLHPDFITALRKLLLGDPNATLVFVCAATPDWIDFVRSSLGPETTASNVVFTGWVSPDDFVELLLIGDVLLDTFHFGGGNTTAEALATGIPIVSLPAAFMRGRFTYAWLRRIGVEDGIATSVDDYVERALRFGKDRDLRLAIKQATLTAAPLAYEDVRCVRAFEEALTRSLELWRA